MARAPARWLAVMAKEPRLGKVKSRLARDIGWVGATAFHRRTLDHLIGRLRFERRWNTVLAVTPDAALWNNCWPSGVALWAQGPGDLGARMGRLMRDLPPGPAVIVGSDIPGIKQAHIARAFRLLGSHDAVFGPADDGGYWLIGLRRSAAPRRSLRRRALVEPARPCRHAGQFGRSAHRHVGGFGGCGRWRRTWATGRHRRAAHPLSARSP